MSIVVRAVINLVIAAFAMQCAEYWKADARFWGSIDSCQRAEKCIARLDAGGGKAARAGRC